MYIGVVSHGALPLTPVYAARVRMATDIMIDQWTWFPTIGYLFVVSGLVKSRDLVRIWGGSSDGDENYGVLRLLTETGLRPSLCKG